MALRLDTREDDFAARFDAFLNGKRSSQPEVESTVAEILASVRSGGDRALAEAIGRFDGVALEPSQFRIRPPALLAQAARVPEHENAALRLAAERIEAFHRRQVPPDLALTDAVGVRMGLRWRPLDSVGIYVPGGKAAYPST
ncbi:MAG: histidinol dehydrogenase, partial [Acetobacteraceae bacterium]